ncbi:hypothetical protein HDU87_001071 [Geranomyces variabilis]|uniref:Uncharacterized protein n=1 Tax=Geranomyces variabilis TaxID=109894 RepID=A0AAD5TQ52_9FUNG|nr:hypothetical protein HDU87_001071 [Geranomyces variabilis]
MDWKDASKNWLETVVSTGKVQKEILGSGVVVADSAELFKTTINKSQGKAAFAELYRVEKIDHGIKAATEDAAVTGARLVAEDFVRRNKRPAKDAPIGGQGSKDQVTDDEDDVEEIEAADPFVSPPAKRARRANVMFTPGKPELSPKAAVPLKHSLVADVVPIMRSTRLSVPKGYEEYLAVIDEETAKSRCPSSVIEFLDRLSQTSVSDGAADALADAMRVKCADVEALDAMGALQNDNDLRPLLAKLNVAYPDPVNMIDDDSNYAMRRMLSPMYGCHAGFVTRLMTAVS